MSKPIKEMIIADYKRRFEGLEGALLVDVRGIPANDNNALRQALGRDSIQVTVVKNTLARKAFAGTKLQSLTDALDGPSALAYGAESVVDVARLLVDWARKIEHLELKAAILDGELFAGAEGVKRLSTFPTRIEAQAKVVALVLAPAGKVVGCAMSPGSKLLGVVKTIEEKLEKGEAITKVA